MKQLLPCFLLFYASLSVFGQQGSIQGSIVSKDGLPVSKTSVMLENSTKGTETNDKGFFSIKGLNAGNYTVVITSVGFDKYKTEVTVRANQVTSMGTITIKESTEFLDEVVISGNGHADFLVKNPSSSLRLQTEVINLPQNIQIVSNQLIKSQNLISMMESVTRNVSGAMMIEHWGHFARINMRGFNLPAFRNGMNVQLPWGPLSEDMSMVQNIEFVKGPAGFMLSAGEPGGFYNVVTKKPQKQRINEISLTVGSFNSYRATFDSGGSLTPDGKLQYRFNGMYERADSFREYEKSNRFSLVPSLKYEISDKTSVTTEFTYQGANQIIGSAYIFAPVKDGFGSLDRDFSFLDENHPLSNMKDYSILTNVTHNFNDKWSVQAQYMFMNSVVDGYSLWLASWLDGPRGKKTESGFDENGNTIRSISKWDSFGNNELAQIYTNGEFNTGGITHKIMGGFDYRNNQFWGTWRGSSIDSEEQPFNIYNPVYGNATYKEFDEITIKRHPNAYYDGKRYLAFYMQDELWLFNDDLRVTLAGRYSNVYDYPNESRDVKVTPRIGVSYNILPDFTIYGLYDVAFTPVYGQSYNNEKFVPRESTDIEGGLKKQWFNGVLNTSLGAYIITRNNDLVDDLEHKDKSGQYRFKTQAGQTQSKGIEFDAQGQITPAINVVFNYAFTNVEFTKHSVESRIGEKVPGHAKHITNGWVNYTFQPETPLHGFGVSLGYQYQVDRASWGWGADNEAFLPDYFRMDGGVSWANDHLRINLNVNNILNEHLYSGSTHSSYLYWQSEPGINGRLTVAYRF